MYKRFFSLQTMDSLARLLPFLRWPRPTGRALRSDAWAGITVGLVLIPQALAYATLAGMPPHTGLYAALLPGIVGILWGSSALLAVGPVALTSLLVYSALAPLAEPGSSQWIVLAIWLSLYAGLIQFALGIFRLGRTGSLVSQPVVVGFINAAAVIIILTQLPALFGMDASIARSGTFIERLWETANAPLVALVGLTAIGLLLGLKRYFPRLPGILLVAVLGIVASTWLGYAEAGGNVVGAIPKGLPALELPSGITFETHRRLWPSAIILALISFTEAMSSCRVLARKTNEQWDENQELIGQGLAKIASGFSGAFAVSGSFSRSALNLYSGARSAWSTLFAASAVLFSLLFLTRYLHNLPHAVLAAIIVVPVFSLLDLSAIRRLFLVSRSSGMIAVTTFATTLLAMPHLYWGVVTGVCLNIVCFIVVRMQPRVVEVGLHPDGSLRDRARFGMSRLEPDILAVRMDSAMNFLSAGALERFVTNCADKDAGIRRVLVCAGSMNDIDASGLDTLESLLASMRKRGIELYLCSVKKQVLDVFEQTGFIRALGQEQIFTTDRQAVTMLKAK
jgi:SulP family sulfate permease